MQTSSAGKKQRLKTNLHDAATKALPRRRFISACIQWQQGNYEQALATLRPLADDLKLTSVYNTLGAIAVQASRAEKEESMPKAAALLTEGLGLFKKGRRISSGRD